MKSAECLLYCIGFSVAEYKPSTSAMSGFSHFCTGGGVADGATPTWNGNMCAACPAEWDWQETPPPPPLPPSSPPSSLSTQDVVEQVKALARTMTLEEKVKLVASINGVVLG